MRKTATTVLIAGVVLVAASCSSVAPIAITARDVCFECRRGVVETRIAAELIDANQMAYKFGSPGCLAKHLADHPGETGTLFVTDFASGGLITVDKATFVPVIVNANTNERDFRAYLSRQEAEAISRDLKVAPIDWQGVLTGAKKS